MTDNKQPGAALSVAVDVYNAMPAELRALELEKMRFELAQRQAQALSASRIVPENFRNNVADCMIAAELAHRMGINVIQVMQSLHVVNGKPGWASQFLIARVNTCGKFSRMTFAMRGEGDGRACQASAKENATAADLVGPVVTVAMAKAEGWATKNGSKWANMADLMLRYRAAAFWCRTFAPELAMGMHTVDELDDLGDPEQNAADARIGRVLEAMTMPARPAAGGEP